MLAHQPLHHLQATCVADYGGVKIVLLRHLKFLGILFLPRWCVYYNDVRFGASLIFSPFIPHSTASVFNLSMENITAALKLLFLSDSVPVYLFWKNHFKLESFSIFMLFKFFISQIWSLFFEFFCFVLDNL